MIKILYLEDDKVIHDVTKEYMSSQDYEVISAYDGECAIEHLNKTTFNLIILDILTPKKTGLEVLEYLKDMNKTIPVIMLSALGDEQIQVTAFNLRADDYIIKPFSPILLLKRIEALLRRTTILIKDNGLVVDKSSYTVSYNKIDLQLTLTEFLIFSTMYDHPNIVYTREMLLELIFEDDYLVNDRIIDAHIKNLRKKLPNNYIKTIIGLGYKYETKE